MGASEETRKSAPNSGLQGVSASGLGAQPVVAHEISDFNTLLFQHVTAHACVGDISQHLGDVYMQIRPY